MEIKTEKIKLLAVSLCIFAIIAAISVHAKQSTQKPARTEDIAVTLISQLPDPAEPRGYVDVRFKFDNNGSGEANNVEAEILPAYPFSLEPGDEAVKSLGTLQSMQRGDAGVIAKYRLRVDENAIEGKNEIKMRYRIDKGIWVQLKEFFVDVQTHDAILSVESVSVGSNMLKPGASDSLKIKLLNNADSALKDIRIELVLGGLPFVPLGSTNEKNFYKIDSRQSHEANFRILANPEAKAGVYQVPLEISYLDELGKKYFRNETIGLVIGAKPELSVILDESEVYEKGKPGEIIIKIVNRGVTDIKFANLQLLPNENFSILSSDEAYLGNIDSDDFETASFRIFARNAKGSVNIPLALEYKDANNNEYKDNINLKIRIYSSSEAKKFGFKKGNNLIGSLIALAIVALGLTYYIRHRRKKRKE